MHRRSFLASIAAVAFDPERLLWRRGRKLISIPAPNIEAPRNWGRYSITVTELLDEYGRTFGFDWAAGKDMSVTFFSVK